MMTILKWLDGNLEKLVAAISTTVILVSCFLGVVSRYVFNMSLTWTEEVTLFAIIWLAYFGSALSVARRRHLRVELIPMFFLKKKGQKVLSILVNVIFLGFAIFIVKGSFDVMMVAKNTNQVFAATGIPRWTSIAAVPIGFAVIALRVFQDTVRHWREYREMGNGRGDTENRS